MEHGRNALRRVLQAQSENGVKECSVRAEACSGWVPPVPRTVRGTYVLTVSKRERV